MKYIDDPFQFNHDSAGPFFHIERWEKQFSGLIAGISTRTSGISKKIDKPLNMNPFMENIGINWKSWSCANQVHGTEVGIVQHNSPMNQPLGEMDGLITSEKGILLTALFADCVPLFFLDPEKEVIGLAHAGWRGTVKNMAGKMVREMTNHFQSKPDQIRAVIGPSIGICCYEVSDEVVEAVYSILSTDREDQWNIKKENGKCHINLQEINHLIMLKEGILPHHIEVTSYCTSCQNSLFYSYRKEKGTTGRQVAFMGWQE
ncbi:peptidoglycan editing factor PgeF [Microaerobacter geothermalis]|uniref:peptidoglycan editing factor PgeF n=1 Tax=Microaerobacter geothermalis TaxID=674972 RepID=UPI001F20EE2D|nr:peptidoglycan editing factor PgeF [Microaerobacter geothermalis]MCF6094738.1 peptidoglycan editing factor PgeF [Microaerobacter geothermalis]